MKWLLSLLIVIESFHLVAAEKPLLWPRFRGPNGSGVADDQRPPVDLASEKNLRWKRAVPPGLSSPIVAGDKLILTAFEDGKLWVMAYSMADGKPVWRQDARAKEIESYFKPDGSPAASTSATDGRHIVSYFGSCGLICHDLEGKQVWRFDLPPAVTAGNFGSGTSPIIVDDTVILVRDELKNSKIYALDLKTGTVKWQRGRQSTASYSTPVAWQTEAGLQVAAPGHARMIGYDLKTGREEWFLTGMPSAACTSPVVADGHLFFAGWSPGAAGDTEMPMPTWESLVKDLDTDKSGDLSRAEAEKVFAGFFDSQDMNKDGKLTLEEWETLTRHMAEGKNSAFALKPGGTGDVTATHKIWHKTKGLPYIASGIVYRGQYIMVKDGGILTAYDAATGKESYQERLAAPGKYFASPVAANGHLYFVTFEDGAISVIKAGEKPEVAATHKLGEKAGATPAIADDTLFVRTEKHLHAFGSGRQGLKTER